MTICKTCGSPVTWTKSGDRWLCLNPDGADHWDLCSQLTMARIKATGEHFSTEREEGYRTTLKKSGVQLVRLSAKSRGPKINNAGCHSCVPPWETCPNGCPAEFKEAP